MSLDRTTIIRGPCQIIYTPATGSPVTSYSQGDVRLSVGHQTFDIVNSAFGSVQERTQQRVATVQYTPVGVIVAGATLIDYWGPYGAKKAGDHMLSSTGDDNLIIQSYAGPNYVKATVYNVATTKIPDLHCSATKTAAGDVTWTGLGQGLPTLQAQNSANTFVHFENGSLPTDAFDPSLIITETYAATLSQNNIALAAPWNSLFTTQGWNCSFDLNLQPVTCDSHGIIDWTVGNVRATARAQLLGVSEVDVANLITTDIIRGAPLPLYQLAITGLHLSIALNATEVKMMPAQYGTATLRLADMEFTGVRSVVGGTIAPVFAVTIT
jgi:hypothetical protein